MSIKDLDAQADRDDDFARQEREKESRAAESEPTDLLTDDEIIDLAGGDGGEEGASWCFDRGELIRLCGIWLEAARAKLSQESRAGSAVSEPSQSILTRAVDMLTAYAELVKATGKYAEMHYIPDVEFVVAELRATLEASEGSEEHPARSNP